jgi:hypothetical protein
VSETAQPEKPADEELPVPTPTTFSYIAGPEDLTPLADDLTAIGITPEMLKDAAQSYNEAFIWKNPLDKIAGALSMDEIDVEAKLGFKKREPPAG